MPFYNARLPQWGDRIFVKIVSFLQTVWHEEQEWEIFEMQNLPRHVNQMPLVSAIFQRRTQLKVRLQVQTALLRHFQSGMVDESIESISLWDKLLFRMKKNSYLSLSLFLLPFRHFFLVLRSYFKWKCNGDSLVRLLIKLPLHNNNSNYIAPPSCAYFACTAAHWSFQCLLPSHRYSA